MGRVWLLQFFLDFVFADFRKIAGKLRAHSVEVVTD